jgi:crossover junction endodeoxyribonuclease RusA
VITFTVAGMPPAPQGSKRHVGNGRMIESSKNVKPWRFLVQQAAVALNQPTITGPVSLSCIFLFPRPKSHYTTKGILKPSAPTYHSVKPDGSKCLRSTEDALVDAGLLQDDARIAISSHTKRYTTPSEHPGAIITIIPLAT